MENYNEVNDDEISLIDLFSVLIKYRKFIILCTLCIFFIGIFVFIVLPKISTNENTFIVEINIPIMIENDSLKNIITHDISTGIITKLKDLKFLSSLNREQNILGYNFVNSNDLLDYNQFINNKVKNNFYVVTLDPTKTACLITIKTTEFEKVEKFIQNLIDKINLEYKNKLETDVKNRLNLLSVIIDNARNNINNNLDLEKLLEEQNNLINISNNNFMVLDHKKSTFILKENKENSIMKLIFCSVAGFFVSVFIAFVLNAIKNIKEDKVASSKIKSAWNEGKKLFP